MPVIKRVCKEDGFCQINNDVLQSQELTYEAKGLLAELLSRPSDWVIRKAQLLRGNCKRDRLNRIFKELQNQGYLEITTLRDKNNVIRDRIWTVYSEPHTEKPNDGKAYVRKSLTQEKQPLQIKSNTKKEKVERKKNVSPEKSMPVSPDNFEVFWKSYPPRRKTEKARAKRYFNRIVPDVISFDDLMARLKNHKNSEDWTKDNGDFVPAPCTWLNPDNERWTDELAPQKRSPDSIPESELQSLCDEMSATFAKR